jgi:hypothetical protein
LTTSESRAKKDEPKSISIVGVGIFVIIIGVVGIYGTLAIIINNALNSIIIIGHNIQVIDHSYTNDISHPESVTYR